ncbi:thioredoxin domain-containing protein [Yaniella flava]|uniref:Thioredoxin domain-containing protein n=1 Tax=Yaniella flava TaxID=287930 RepID=A0ABP5FGH2_9MICC|nr:thioredoxin domain-containing protein [Micrococcaceae bacterium]
MTPSRNATSARLWVMPVLVTLGIVAALIAAFFWGRSTVSPQADPGNQPPQQQGTEQAQAVPDEVVDQVISRDSDDPLAIGAVDAPVVMVMFSDYQCPFCSRWTHDTLPEMQQFVDDGELRVEFRDINMYGEDSRRAATASVAAGMQDQFEEYHDLLFPDGETLEDFSTEALVELAADNGLDTEQFEEDMESEQTADIVAENEELGQSIGATSTPTFLMNNTPIVGAQPSEVFIESFEEELAAAEE